MGKKVSPKENMINILKLFLEEKNIKALKFFMNKDKASENDIKDHINKLLKNINNIESESEKEVLKKLDLEKNYIKNYFLIRKKGLLNNDTFCNFV